MGLAGEGVSTSADALGRARHTDARESANEGRQGVFPPVGSRVVVKHVTAYQDYLGTVTAPATQAGMAVQVDIDGVGLVEFRSWEVEALP